RPRPRHLSGPHDVSTLELQAIAKSFDAVTVLHHIDLAVEPGEFVVFVGPSGCGKSTLLRLIAGLDQPSAGEIRIDGRRVNEIGAADRGCAMVFQSYALYPHMTVHANMAFGLENVRTPRPEIERKVRAAAELLQLDALLQRKPTQLSGGQRQRVAIGRAIVRNPTVFLFDEPLSNLDAALRMSMRIELTKLHRELGTTMVYVTHDQVEAMTMGDRIAVLNAGRIEQVGRPLDLYREPDNLFVARFLGTPSINVVPCPGRDASAAHRALWAHATPGRTQASAFHCVGIRPEHLQVQPDGGSEGVAATLVLAEHLGDASILHLQVEGLADLLQARIPLRGEGLSAGQRVLLIPEAGRVLAFDAAGSRVPE
ncbi:MAG: sn-glycerol-3-phosphate transporter ATP-binding protein UgpC, partial [Pseudomonadota bacterium]